MMIYVNYHVRFKKTKSLCLSVVEWNEAFSQAWQLSDKSFALGSAHHTLWSCSFFSVRPLADIFTVLLWLVTDAVQSVLISHVGT